MSDATPAQRALDVGLHAFLNCYLRETDAWRIDDGRVHVELPRRGAEVRLDLAYRSPTLRHRFELPARLVVDDRDAGTIGVPALVALLLDELGDADQGSPIAVLGRVIDSIDATEHALTVRADELDRLWGAGELSFLETEQALLVGHMVHPTPKSRGDMGAAERDRFSPETAGRFPLHWLSVDRDAVRQDSALDVPAEELVRVHLRDEPGDDLRRVLVPAHPFQARLLADDPTTADLFSDGTVIDLGPIGAEMWPTTSVRTVARPDESWQLKFSLNVRVTNSMRVTLPKELGRAVEAARLDRSPVGELARRVAPDLHLVQDPAYLAVVRDGEVVSGFSVLVRDGSWTRRADGSFRDITALTTLCQDFPGGGPSRLGAIVDRLAAGAARPRHEVAREWFARFCSVVVGPLVRLYGEVGLCFEAHQQNTLVELDGGWPARGLYRDSQGYFHRELAHGDITAVLPGHGEVTESIFPEELADERLVYYLFLNMALGVINALGVAGCVDEAVLLGDLRRLLEAERARDTRYPLTLVDHVLDDRRWPCKGNLRTRLHDMDELVGDIATQSVYVAVPNPLVGV